jgi:predicted nucleic acid-binding protein
MVLDASAAVELLLNTPAGNRVASRLEDETEVIHAPHLIDIEVVQVLRRHLMQGLLQDARVGRALGAYDAVYVALAEALSVPLVTGDEKLARAPGLHARIELA